MSDYFFVFLKEDYAYLNRYINRLYYYIILTYYYLLKNEWHKSSVFNRPFPIKSKSFKNLQFKSVNLPTFIPLIF